MRNPISTIALAAALAGSAEPAAGQGFGTAPAPSTGQPPVSEPDAKPSAASSLGRPLFDYTPPSGGVPGSAGVCLAVVAPYWNNSAEWTRVGIYADFTSALRGDFFELVTARGFTSRGPFRTYAAMLFPDKDGCDLVLTPELDLKVAFGSLQKKTEFLTQRIKFKGKADIGGRVNLSLSESLTNERMWMKSIEVPGIAAKFETKRWLDKDTPLDEVSRSILSDPGFTAVIAPVLDSMYAQILQTAWNYLEPAEVRQVKEQSLEVRRRKAY